MALSMVKTALSDVYVYTMQIQCTDGSMYNAKGSITLLR